MPTAQPILSTPSATNFSFIFDSNLSFSNQISSLSSSCHYHIQDLCCIRHNIDFTASIISTSLIHSWLDYCNSLYHSLPITQLKGFQQIQNALARAIIRTHKHSHITLALQSLHWLKVEQCLQYKIISITHNLLRISESTYLRNLINIKSTGKTSYHFCVSPFHQSPPSLNSPIVPSVISHLSVELYLLILDLSLNSHLHLPYQSLLSLLFHLLHSFLQSVPLLLEDAPLIAFLPPNSSTNLTYPTTFYRSVLYVDTRVSIQEYT